MRLEKRGMKGKLQGEDEGERPECGKTGGRGCKGELSEEKVHRRGKLTGKKSLGKSMVGKTAWKRRDERRKTRLTDWEREVLYRRGCAALNTSSYKV